MGGDRQSDGFLSLRLEPFNKWYDLTTLVDYINKKKRIAYVRRRAGYYLPTFEPDFWTTLEGME